MKDKIYVRCLRAVPPTVFCVGSKNQKTYYDSIFRKYSAFSSGPQVKYSMFYYLDRMLNVLPNSVKFKWKLSGSTLEEKEAITIIDTKSDGILRGWMSMPEKKKKKTGAKKKDVETSTDEVSIDEVSEDNEDKTEKEDKKDISAFTRRSPFSISAMTPIHPLAATLNKDNVTFNRNEYKNSTFVISKNGKEMTEKDAYEWLKKNNRGTDLCRKFIVNGIERTNGLFYYDVAIDLSRLFTISTNPHVLECDEETIKKLEDEGWIKVKDGFVANKEIRDKYIPAIAESLINLEITSNQATNYAIVNVLAVAISDRANDITNAITTELIDDIYESDSSYAKLVLDNSKKNLYVGNSAKGYISNLSIENEFKLDNAEQKIIEMLQAYDYEYQY
jgi:hypothetical protein